MNPTEMEMEQFFQPLYWDNEARLAAKRNVKTDRELYLLNHGLVARESELIDRHYDPSASLIFVVGVPRSGTTLLSQLLVNYFSVCYISNRIASYWRAPLYRSMTTGHTFDVTSSRGYASSLGSTDAEDSPHEFGYFWQHWFRHQSHDELDVQALHSIDWKGLTRQLLAYAAYWKRPLVVKNPVYHSLKIQWLAQKFPSAVFLHIERDPKYVMQSIMEARVKRYGRAENWWSVRPAQFESWKRKSAVQQIAQQYDCVYKRISDDLKTISRDRTISIRYEDLIDDTIGQLQRIEQTIDCPLLQSADPGLTSTNIDRLDATVLGDLDDALHRLIES